MLWHALCISLGWSGCIFFLPLVPEENELPTLVASNPSDGNELLISTDAGVLAFVLVQDADDPSESLSFLWWLESSGEILPSEPMPPQDQGDAGSEVRLLPQRAYDGQTLHCRVSDGQDALELSWPVRVIAEGT